MALTGQGGWPMSVFVDHDGRPYADVLPSGAAAWHAVVPAAAPRDQRDLGGATRRRARRRGSGSPRRSARVASPPATTCRRLPRTSRQPWRRYPRHGRAFGRIRRRAEVPAVDGPGVPPAGHHARHDGLSLAMAAQTLEAMARGGMYDQVGGGFARYSVDADWVVPHFGEDALRQRAPYAGVPALVAPDRLALAERVVRETAEFLLTELRTPRGGFARTGCRQ